jgi:hypothetical protein
VREAGEHQGCKLQAVSARLKRMMHTIIIGFILNESRALFAVRYAQIIRTIEDRTIFK